MKKKKSYFFSLLFCVQSQVPCGRTSCRKYCHAVDLEIIKLNEENVEYKKTKIENRILDSNKNVVEETETWKTLEEFIIYSFMYFISSTVNFILMILLVNQWYL